MDFESLKKVGGDMMETIAAFGIKHRSRSELRTFIVEKLRWMDLNTDEKRFVGDYVMALHGYGGGL